MKNQEKLRGFTLIEVMIVVVIIGILVMLILPFFLPPSAEFKMAEAKRWLKEVSAMEEEFLRNYQVYWGGAEAKNCTKGRTYTITASAESRDQFARIGISLPADARYTYTLSATDSVFYCRAIANLDSDPTLDTWSVNQLGALTHEIDDSAD